MNRSQDQGRPIPAELRDTIQRDFEDSERILWLSGKFLVYSSYNREFFQTVLRAARRDAGESWSLRCFALALLERQLAMLDPFELSEFDEALVSLGLKKSGENWVQTEIVGGGPEMTLAEFVPHLLRKINRRADAAARRAHSARALADLLHRSTQECKLTLASCVFRPEEVFERILTQLKVSEGVPLSGFAQIEEKSAFIKRPLSLGPYECQIARELQRSNHVFWVGDSTSSRINSLVEYPFGTVALVLKLPGSDVEIELKRAGKRESPLGVVYERAGIPVPVSHRLQGGSTGWMLQAESDNESRFRALFRDIHQEDPPLSRTLFITNIRRVPCKSGTADLLTWFMDAETFGAGYQEMRSAIRSCLEAGGSPVPASPLGRTVAFLRDAKPRQSFLAGTSSFRLDRLTEYLSPKGPERYFGDGLGIECTGEQARQFADDLMEELLGNYVQPNVCYRNHDQYLKAAFKVRVNRVLAHANYMFCMEQIGILWGTMLAIGAYSMGESFVPRNVGLKAVWQDRAWKVMIIFMDHDCLESPRPEQLDFHPATVMAGTIHDETHIFGHALSHRANIGAVTCLEEIYRVTETVARRGRRQLRAAMLRSFCAARATRSDLLSSAYRAQLFDFEEVVRISLDPRLTAKREEHLISWLRSKGYSEQQSREYQETAKEYARFFKEYAFLYQQRPSG